MASGVYEVEIPTFQVHCFSDLTGMDNSGRKRVAKEKKDCAQPLTEKKRRKQVAKACINCRKSKSGCSDKRPCERCISHKLTDSCIDVPRKKRFPTHTCQPAKQGESVYHQMNHKETREESSFQPSCEPTITLPPSRLPFFTLQSLARSLSESRINTEPPKERFCHPFSRTYPTQMNPPPDFTSTRALNLNLQNICLMDPIQTTSSESNDDLSSFIKESSKTSVFDSLMSLSKPFVVDTAMLEDEDDEMLETIFQTEPGKKKKTVWSREDLRNQVEEDIKLSDEWNINTAPSNDLLTRTTIIT